MRPAERKKVLTPSTVEAIRMASASILGYATEGGYPLGSAMGSGSMLERNSETVATSVTPLVLSVRDSIRSSEGIDLLSVEWDLKRTPDAEVLPEQLTIVSNAESTGGTIVCVLSWEKGVVDPFKVIDHVREVSKKMTDVERAAVNSGLSPAAEGLLVLKRFSNRLNRVFFVDVMDRRFQGSWDSMQVKPEQVQIETRIVEKCREDFTRVPPGLRVTGISGKQFLLPETDETSVVRHFQSRILTPRGLEVISVVIPELGQTILNELNTYAYSQEESEIVDGITKLFVTYSGSDKVKMQEVPAFSKKADDFSDQLHSAVDIFSSVAEGHVRSGKTLTLSEHRAAMVESPEIAALSGIPRDLTMVMMDTLMESLHRSFPVTEGVRAWQMRSSVSYFVAYCRRVSQYFAGEVSQYLLVSSARAALSEAMQRFRQRATQDAKDPLDLLLFQKFYAELYAQLNAVFDKSTYRQSLAVDLTKLMNEIVKEITRVFESIDVWDLIDFGDVAHIARSEIKARYESSGALDPRGHGLEDILASMEQLVGEIVPDVAETILSRDFVRELASSLAERGISPSRAVLTLASQRIEKPPEWTRELKRWMDDYDASLKSSDSLGDKLLKYLELVHDRVGSGITARSVLDRISSEAARLQQGYDRKVSEWERQCIAVESENAPILAHNEQRKLLLDQAGTVQANEEREYQANLLAYKEHLKVAELGVSDAQPAPLSPPTPPMNLNQRLQMINLEHPLRELIPLPSRPTPSESLTNHCELRDLIAERIQKMGERQESMETLFSENLRALEAETASLAERVSIEMQSGFPDFVMNSVVRNLGRLLPYPTRAYLRDPSNPSVIYLVTYEHKEQELSVTIGNNLLG